jgi:hypothetical protein
MEWMSPIPQCMQQIQAKKRCASDQLGGGHRKLRRRGWINNNAAGPEREHGRIGHGSNTITAVRIWTYPASCLAAPWFPVISFAGPVVRPKFFVDGVEAAEITVVIGDDPHIFAPREVSNTRLINRDQSQLELTDINQGH